MRYPTLLFILLLAAVAAGQDVANLNEATFARVSGSLRLSGQYYAIDGITARAAPFQFGASGRLNLRLLEEFNVPISFTFGRQRPGLNFPVYRQFGLSPRYKWITLHAGYRNMQLSRFSLNNHTFLGVGLELEPGKFRLAAMSGRLRQGAREVSEDIDLFFSQPLYDRFAKGARIGYGSEESHFDLTYFRAEDREARIPLADSVRRPSPAENIVIGARWQQRFGERFRLEAEAAASGFNRNKDSGEFELDDFPRARLLGSLFTPRYSSQTGLALKGALTYTHNAFLLGVDYERIDPGFESMGTYFLNGDWENIRGTLGFGLWKNAVNVQTSLGFQRNNLLELRAETSRRLIGSANASARLGNRSALSFQYANFSQDQRPTALVVFNDTLRIASTTTNYGGSYTTSGTGGKGQPLNSFTAALNYQRTNNDNPLSRGFDALTTLFGSLSLSRRLANERTTLTAGTNVTRINVADRETLGLGGTLGWRQSLADNRLRISVTNTFNHNRVGGSADGFSNALRSDASWKVGKLQTFSLGFSWLKRRSSSGFGFSEQRGTLSYGLTLPTVATGKKER